MPLPCFSSCAGSATASCNDTEQAWMLAACASAYAGVVAKDGGPFGCSIVNWRTNRLVSCEHNTVLLENNPTRHGEMNALRVAANRIFSSTTTGIDADSPIVCGDANNMNPTTSAVSGDVVDPDIILKNSTTKTPSYDLYTTAEPCPMCRGAIARAPWIRNVYVGVDRDTAAAFGFNDKAFYDEMDGVQKWLDKRQAEQGNIKGGPTSNDKGSSSRLGVNAVENKSEAAASPEVDTTTKAEADGATSTKNSTASPAPSKKQDSKFRGKFLTIEIVKSNEELQGKNLNYANEDKNINAKKHHHHSSTHPSLDPAQMRSSVGTPAVVLIVDGQEFRAEEALQVVGSTTSLDEHKGEDPTISPITACIELACAKLQKHHLPKETSVLHCAFERSEMYLNEMSIAALCWANVGRVKLYEGLGAGASSTEQKPANFTVETKQALATPSATTGSSTTTTAAAVVEHGRAEDEQARPASPVLELGAVQMSVLGEDNVNIPGVSSSTSAAPQSTTAISSEVKQISNSAEEQDPSSKKHRHHHHRKHNCHEEASKDLTRNQPKMNILKDQCAQVFRTWKKVNGIVY
ncbi:unnamed protein product [Amoebophrya sp. A120]|nr:unnamed protein product [Amoebophrya sp. A120]|eukprot:GSA120T00012599001.1